MPGLVCTAFIAGICGCPGGSRVNNLQTYIWPLAAGSGT